MTLAQIFKSDSRIVLVREYTEGFVPLSYKWRCPRHSIDNPRVGKSWYHQYDAKRSGGNGPAWVAYSLAGGRLASGQTALEV